MADSSAVRIDMLLGSRADSLKLGDQIPQALIPFLVVPFVIFLEFVCIVNLQFE